MTKFKELKIVNFRNIGCQTLKPEDDDIVLIGSNGQGKTNLLEAIYTLCYGSSFKATSLRDCVRHGESGFILEGRFLNEYEEIQCIRSVFENGKRYIEIDGKEIKDRKELIYQFPCIVFCHEDIEFIKGEPETRRKFFDQMMSLTSPDFIDLIRMYRNVLSKRNAAIKNSQLSLLPIYDEKLAGLGLDIMERRQMETDGFNCLFPELFKRISGGKDDLEITYLASWSGCKTKEDIMKVLSSTVDRDLKMMTTTSGIHRDRFVIRDSHGLFSQTGSTGQIRLASLLFRVAEAKSFYRLTGKKPILLLDDVLLELDDQKRALFLDELDEYSQAFYTFLPRERYFSETGKKHVCYSVVNGEYRLDG